MFDFHYPLVRARKVIRKKSEGKNGFSGYPLVRARKVILSHAVRELSWRKIYPLACARKVIPGADPFPTPVPLSILSRARAR